MASSVTMAAAFLAAPSCSLQLRRPGLIITNSGRVSVKANSQVKASCENNQEDNNIIIIINNNNNNNNGRREMLVAVALAAAALGSSAPAPGPALAQEPKRGTPQAKKAYAPVCVSNPTARICNN